MLVEAFEKNALDAKAKEHKFEKQTITNSIKDTDYRERAVNQVEAFRVKDMKTLRQINEVNLEALKEAKMARNSMGMSDFGNFVMAPEMLTEIQGKRTNYATLLAATNWQETLSMQMAWLERDGDIDMDEVDYCESDDGSVGDNGNLKPIKTYGATLRTSDLHEVAAVTPICSAATRFLATDILSDVAAGYRNAYDNKRAELVIARL